MLIVFIVSTILFEIIIGYYFISLKNIALPDSEKIELILHNIFTLIKTFLGIIIIFVAGNFCLLDNDQYALLFITGKVKKYKYYLSKFILIDLLIIGYLLFIFTSIILQGLIFSNHFRFDIKYLKQYIYWLIVLLIYAKISQILVKLINNYFTIIIVLMMFLLSDLLMDNAYLTLLFPTILINDCSILSFSFFIPYLFILLFYSIMNNLLFFEKK